MSRIVFYKLCVDVFKFSAGPNRASVRFISVLASELYLSTANVWPESVLVLISRRTVCVAEQLFSPDSLCTPGLSHFISLWLRSPKKRPKGESPFEPALQEKQSRRCWNRRRFQAKSITMYCETWTAKAAAAAAAAAQHIGQRKCLALSLDERSLLAARKSQTRAIWV